MGDRLEYVNGRNYQRIDNGLGISFQLDYGFRVDYEHVFTSSTDNLGDMNLGPSALRLLSGHNSPVARAYRGYKSRRPVARLRRLRRKPGKPSTYQLFEQRKGFLHFVFADHKGAQLVFGIHAFRHQPLFGGYDVPRQIVAAGVAGQMQRQIRGFHLHQHWRQLEFSRLRQQILPGTWR